MKTAKHFFAIISIVIAAILALACLFPIPYKLKDGGTTVLTPAVTTYTVYVYNTEIPQEDSVVYKKGFAIELFGQEIIDRSYFSNIEN